MRRTSTIWKPGTAISRAASRSGAWARSTTSRAGCGGSRRPTRAGRPATSCMLTAARYSASRRLPVADAHELGIAAVQDVATVFERVPAETIERMCEELERANRIVCYGVGREGLMMRALAMRLYHLGLDVNVVGDMSAPPVGS